MHKADCECISCLTRDTLRYRWIRDATNLEIRTHPRFGTPWTNTDTGKTYYPTHNLSAYGTGFYGLETLDELMDQAMELYPPINKMKKCEILEQKVKELNAEIKRLKGVENGIAVPTDFGLDLAIDILNGTVPKAELFYCFTWMESPQGKEFWNRVHNLPDDEPMPDEAVIQLQKWVIHSLLDKQS